MSPNFHPIRPRPTPLTKQNLVPQIQPKVPGVETDSGEPRVLPTIATATDTSIITNDNNGVWFIEEKVKEPFKRDFMEESNRTTINPALTERPRTWPSILKKPDISDVNIVEKSRHGEIGQQGPMSESTTFSTSRVSMSMSTTPSPQVLEKLKTDKDSARRNLLLMKAHKLLDSLASKEEQLDAEDHVVRLGPKGKRKRLRQQPKSLAGVKDDTYVVYPMDRIHTENKEVDEIFGNHPGLKRISAYDFERAMEKAEDTITKPVAELKVSIEELADTMTKLSKNVLETSTKNDEVLTSEDKISQLQEEIAKLTKTLETLQLAPKGNPKESSLNVMRNVKVDDLMLSPTEQQIRVMPTERPLRVQFQGSESIKTWHQDQRHEVIDTNETNLGKLSDNSKLDIIEVYPSTTTTTRRPVTITPRPNPRKVAKTTRQQPLFREIVTTETPVLTTERVQKILPQKVDTSEIDLKTFFGDNDEDDEPIVGQENDSGRFSPKAIINNQFDSGLKSSQGFNDAISQDQRPGVDDNSVLGLFEMMGKINKEAAKNFDVVRLRPTQTENSIKAVQQQLLLEEMQEKLQREQIDKIKAEEEELRRQQMEKLKLFNLFQEEEKKLKQEKMKKLNDQDKFGSSSVSVKGFDSLQGWSQDDSNGWQDNGDKSAAGDRGTAYATLTIENVDLHQNNDYEVNNGIVTLKKDHVQDIPNNLEFDYEYYEADPDDIQFPVGGTRQFYESQAKKTPKEPLLGNLSQLSNKDLLLNLLEASNNFQNREFLDRLKNIVRGSTDDGERDEKHFTSSGDHNNLNSVRTDKWAPAEHRPTSSSKLENNVNNLPIWPSNSNDNGNIISAVRTEDFKPSNAFRFPTRRIDNGDLDQGGVGEISLVSDSERRKITSVGGFQEEAVRKPDYKISDRLDFTSDNEFVVGTSLSMNQGASPQSNNNYGFNSGVGLATAITPRAASSQLSPISVTPAPALSPSLHLHSTPTSSSSRGAEVFHLNSGVHVQQPRPGHSPISDRSAGHSNQNYILPTYTSDTSSGTGEIYADIRLESGKKNLLTAGSGDTGHGLYIASNSGHDRPEAEVIVYPMGQLLSSGQPTLSDTPHGYSRSATHHHDHDVSQRRDQLPAAAYHSIPSLDADLTPTILTSQRRKTAPKGLLETIIRTAKDDLDFAGNVLSYITSRTQ